MKVMEQLKGIIAALLILASTTSIAQTDQYNPFKKFNKESKVLTLSNGRYNEFHDQDSIVLIGAAIFNTRTMKVVGLVEYDTLYSEATLEPNVVSRWLSPDPLAAKYPGWSPYKFALNNPLIYIDPEGSTEYYFNGKWIGSDNEDNNLIAIVKSKQIKKEIKKGIHQFQDPSTLTNGTNNENIFVIDATVLETADNVLDKALTKRGENREYGTRLNNVNGNYELIPEGVIEGDPIDIRHQDKAEVDIPGKGGVVIHSHLTGTDYNPYTDKVSGFNALVPSQIDKDNMDNVEMSIIVGKQGDPNGIVTTNQMGDRDVNIYPRSNGINFYNASNKKKPVQKIGRKEAKGIIKDHKKR